MGRTKNGYPEAKFTLELYTKSNNGKSQKKLVGSFLNENGEKILISVDIKKLYKAKKNGKQFHYARAINLGHHQERQGNGRSQMG